MRLIRGQTSISVPKNNFRFSGKPRQPTPRQDQNRPHVQFPQSAHTESKELAPTFLRRKVASPVQADLVTDWNDVTMEAVIAARDAQPTQARSVTMVHVAMFEAINAIERRYTPYVVKVVPSPGASREAAAASAAYAVLTKLYPNQRASFDKTYAISMAKIPDSEAKTSGISFGERIAQEIYDTRAVEMGSLPNAYRPRTTPGVYVATP